MKKLLCIALLLAIPISANAAGVYDGIWLDSNSSYATVTQNDNEVVVVVLGRTFLFWEAYLGNLEGNSVVVTKVVGPGTAELEIEFVDENSALVTVVSCSPCVYPVGTLFTATKVFG